MFQDKESGEADGKHVEEEAEEGGRSGEQENSARVNGLHNGYVDEEIESCPRGAKCSRFSDLFGKRGEWKIESWRSDPPDQIPESMALAVLGRRYAVGLRNRIASSALRFDL